MRLANKIALITGAASGIGAATATRFVREGAKVYLADINTDQGQSVADKLAMPFVALDVASENAWQQAIASISDERLDILVNNAGISPHDTVEDLQLDIWHKIHAVVLDSVALGCKHALPLLKQSTAGAVVNLSSIAGMIGASSYASYGSAKAGVRNLSKSFAMLCAERGYPIRCNSVHPGSIDTPILDADKALHGERAVTSRQRAIPLKRLGQAEEVANAILFLASDEASFITGTELIVDGGFTAR